MEQNHAGPVRTRRKRDEAYTDKPDGRRENNPDLNVSGEESDRKNHTAGHCAMKHNDVHVAKRARNGVEEKKRETSPKPLNLNAQNIWRCRDPGISASRPRRDEIRKAKGMARRMKERQYWAGTCAGMTMALVYIEPLELPTPPPRANPGPRGQPKVCDP